MAIFTGSGVALVTPFHEDESINYDKLDEMLDYHCTHGTDSIIICGTTGESSTLSEEEHMECIKFAIERVKGSCKMQLDAIPLIEKLFCEVNPIPVKKALNLMGWQAGPLRMPLTEMTEAHTAQLAKELEAFGIKLA